jgi:hypothetical protein
MHNQWTGNYAYKQHILWNKQWVETSVYLHIDEYAILIYLYVMKWPEDDLIFVKT